MTTLIVVVVAAAVVAAYLYHHNPEANTVAFELMKTSLSVFGVSLVGALAIFAFGILRRDRDRRLERAQRNA